MTIKPHWVFAVIALGCLFWPLAVQVGGWGAPTTVRMADLNNDQMQTAADARLALQWSLVFPRVTPTNWTLADRDSDGVVTAYDAARIQQRADYLILMGQWLETQDSSQADGN